MPETSASAAMTWPSLPGMIWTVHGRDSVTISILSLIIDFIAGSGRYCTLLWNNISKIVVTLHCLLEKLNVCWGYSATDPRKQLSTCNHQKIDNLSALVWQDSSMEQPCDYNASRSNIKWLVSNSNEMGWKWGSLKNINFLHFVKVFFILNMNINMNKVQLFLYSQNIPKIWLFVKLNPFHMK